LRKRDPGRAPLLFAATTPTAGGEVPSLPGPLADLVEARSGFASDVELETRRLWLERLSCVSLDESLLPTAAPIFQFSDSVALDPEHPLLWARSGDHIVAAARGDSVVLPNRDVVVRTLQTLNEGVPCRVEALQSLAADAGPDVTRVLERLATIRAVVVKT